MFHGLSYPPPHMHESYNHLYILSDLRVMISCYFELYTEFIVYNCIVLHFPHIQLSMYYQKYITSFTGKNTTT